MKTTFKRALSVILALCVLVASATCLMGISVFAEEKEIKLLSQIDESKAAEKNRVVFSRQENGTPAYNAFDGKITNDNSNQWWAADTVGYIIIDLGAVYDLSYVEYYGRYTAAGDRTYTFDVYTASTLSVEYAQANNADVAAAMRKGTKILSGAKNTKHTTHTFTEGACGRYVMFDITDGTGQINAAEIQVYGSDYTFATTTNGGAPVVEKNIAHNYISGLDASAKAEKVLGNKTAAGKPYYAFDGVVANNGNKNQWYPGAAPAYMVVDLGKEYNLTALNISFRTKATGNRTFTYSIYTVSDLGEQAFTSANLANVYSAMKATTVIASGTATCVADHTFAKPVHGRYVLIDITAASGDVNFFEFEIFGYSLTSTYEIDEVNKTISVPGGFGLTVNDLLNSLTLDGNAYLTLGKEGTEALQDGDLIFVNHAGTTLSTDITTTFPGATVYTVKTTTPNLVAGATNVLSSGHEEGNTTALNAFDGNISNANADKWMVTSGSGKTIWLAVDLGANYNLTSAQSYIYGKVGDTQERNYYYDLYIADADDFSGDFVAGNEAEIGAGIMANGTKMASVDSTNSTYGGTFSELNATGRYVLLHYTGGKHSATMSLYELELFGYQFESTELKIDEATKTINVPYSFGSDVSAEKILGALDIANAVASVDGNKLTLTYSKGNTVATKTYTILYPNFTGIGQSIIAGLSTQDEKMNVVLGSAGGYNNPAYPFKILDGVVVDANNNKWFSNNTPTDAVPHYVIVDLGKAYNITGLNLALSAVRDHTYTIHTIADLGDVAFTRENADAVQQKIINDGTLIVSQTTNKGTKDFTVDNAFGRYVLVNITKCVEGTTPKSSTILEFEIFGYTLASKSGNVKFDYENNTIITPFAWGNDVTIADVLADISILGNAKLTATSDKIVVSTMSGDTVEYTLECGKADDEFTNAYVNVHNNISNALAFYNKDDQKITLADAKVDDTVKVSFEYYTSTSQIYQLVFEGTATASSNQGVRLSVGRNKFEQTITVTGEGDITPYIKKLSGGNAIYVWNITIEINGVDQNVTYANAAGTTTYVTKDEASKTLGLDLSKDHFVTKYDLSTLDPSTVTQNMLVGAFMGSNVHVPSANEITVSYDYFLPGTATGVFVTTAANNTSGNPAAAIEGNALKFGMGSISGTATQKMSGAVSAMAAIGIKAGAEVYPDSFYVWNLKLETEDFGTITYIEVPQSQINAYKNSSTDRTILSGFSFTKTTTAVTAGEESTYVYADVPSDIVYGNVNGIDEVVDICDLVYLNNADSTFKDIRAFDVDKDSAKSNADHFFLIGKIWEALGF